MATVLSRSHVGMPGENNHKGGRGTIENFSLAFFCDSSFFYVEPLPVPLLLLLQLLLLVVAVNSR